MSTILITGASGLLGSNLASYAGQIGHQVIATYNRNNIEIPGVQCVQIDLTDSQAVENLLQGYRPDWVVHCAAATDVDWCEAHEQETFLTNAEASRHVALQSKRSGSGLIYISTDSVFDGQSGYYGEKDTVGPVNVYAASKLAGELAVLDEINDVLILRTNIYGWNARDKRSLAEWILDRLDLGQDVGGFCDVIFTPVLVNDLAEIVFSMMEEHMHGVYHVGSSTACSKYDFALQLADVFNLDGQSIRPIPIREANLRAPRPMNTSLNTGKLKRDLRRELPSIESGLYRFKELRDSGFVTTLKSFQ